VSISAAALVPPHAEPADGHLPLWRFVPRFISNPLAALPAAVYDDRFVVRSGPRTTVWVTAPDLIEQILLIDHSKIARSAVERRALGPTLGNGLLTSDGAAWKWQRRTTAPVFRHAEVLALVPAMAIAAQAQVTAWLALNDGTRRFVDRDMEETTFKIISDTIFAGAVEAEGRTIQNAGSTILRNITWPLVAGILNLPNWIWHPGKHAIARAAAESRAAVADILTRRRAAGADGADITARLINARDPETGAPMSDPQLIDNLLTFLAAGHETTAKALTWMLYLLARAPEWQERVAEEVRRVAGDATLTAEHLDHLDVTRQVVKEGMRLYPPAPIISRVATEPMRFDGHDIARGTIIVVPIYAVHRHRKIWDAPDTFDPSRFEAAHEAKHARAQFMPFGFGPRICIGMSFAMLEATLLLATFVRGMRFDWDGVHKPEPINRITLRPRGGMPLILSRRKKPL
jgi:cytochrome P450